MKEKKDTSKRIVFYVAISLLIAFCIGVFLQSRYDIQKGILKFIVSRDTLQRQKLKDILKVQTTESWSEVKIKSEKDYPLYKEQLLDFVDRESKEVLSAYLLIPNAAGSNRSPAVLCIHGHHSTKEDVAGITESKYNINYGHTLVKNNYIVLIPEIRYSQDIWRLEDPMALRLLLNGRSLTSERVRDLIRCVSFLEGYPSVDPKKIGVVGWSMGGGLALYLSAVDTRIKVAYISCYFGTYEGTIMSVRQSTDNYVPGILGFGELYDVAALIAPRPLFIEHGSPDREFPVEGAKMAFDYVNRTYLKMGESEKVKFVVREGGHRFYGDQLIPWFETFLPSD